MGRGGEEPKFLVGCLAELRWVCTDTRTGTCWEGYSERYELAKLSLWCCQNKHLHRLPR